MGENPSVQKGEIFFHKELSVLKLQVLRGKVGGLSLDKKCFF